MAHIEVKTENPTPSPQWLKNAVIYELNPKTFTSPDGEGSGSGSGTFRSTKEKLEYLKKTPPEELFSVEELHDTPPSEARIFSSVKCDGCKELTAENMLRLQNGKKLCLDCYRPYTRFIL